MAPITSATGPEILAAGNNDGTATSWLEANWMFLSWAGALFGLGVLVGRIHQRNPYWYGWLALIMYNLHQSEEHAYDFRGWRYAFVPHLNESIGKTLFSSLCSSMLMPACPVDPKITLYINTIIIWVGFGGCMLAAHIRPERFLLAGSLSWGTAVVNGLFGHVLPAVASFTYNPGLVQSIIMVPLGIYIIRSSGRPWLCMANGFGAHVMMVMGINVLYRAELPEAATTTMFNLLGSLALPLGISWILKHPVDAYKYEPL